jgi:hypothetical protein
VSVCVCAGLCLCVFLCVFVCLCKDKWECVAVACVYLCVWHLFNKELCSLPIVVFLRTAHTHPLNSAYMLANNQEPDFTNHAQIRDDHPFIETLDYVFLSPSWRVTGVEALSHRESVVGPYPTEHEPSDHVLIAANLIIESEDRFVT